MGFLVIEINELHNKYRIEINELHMNHKLEMDIYRIEIQNLTKKLEKLEKTNIAFKKSKLVRFMVAIKI